MLVRELSWDEVVHAGTVLFGPAFASTARAGAWRYDLKRAYRRRVLETHPDRAATLGRSEAELVREFRAVAEAYELLVQLRAGPLPAARSAPPPRPAPPPPRAARAAGSVRRPQRGSPRAAPPPTVEPAPPRHAVHLPRRRLRLAEFLYYSGRVGWHDFVSAVAWQRAQRPAVGRIAVEFGFLTRPEVTELLERRRVDGAGREPFGEYAVRRGYLTPFQLLAMLGQQLRLQRPIGRYFAERGLVSDGELDEARRAVFRHNARHA